MGEREIPTWVIVCLIVKLALSLVMVYCTHFVPDEFWQSTEVAHFHYFGWGHLTWEWLYGLRSICVSKFIERLYQVLKDLGDFDQDPFYLAFGPALAQGLLSSMGVVAFYKYAHKVLARKQADIAVDLMIFNWFTTYCFSRPITNQTELSLNCIGLCLLEYGQFATLAIVCAVNFMVRPTTCVYWGLLFFNIYGKIETVSRNSHEFFWNFCKFFLVGSMVVVSFIRTDFAATGKITFLEFYNFNFATEGAAIFGEHPFSWYFYSALPSIIFWYLPLLPYAHATIDGTGRFHAVYTLFFLLTFSFVGHKEIRFVLPILPSVFIALGAAIPKFKGLVGNHCKLTPVLFLLRKMRAIYIAAQVVVAVYIGFFHQSGTFSASNFVWSSMRDLKTPKIWVMTPCYTIPVNTFLHAKRAEIESYICPPEQFASYYTNESSPHYHKSQLFQTNGLSVEQVTGDMQKMLDAGKTPHFIITFSGYNDGIQEVLKKNDLDYYVCKQIPYYWYSAVTEYINGIPEHKSYIMVICKSSVRSHVEAASLRRWDDGNMGIPMYP